MKEKVIRHTILLDDKQETQLEELKRKVFFGSYSQIIRMSLQETYKKYFGEGGEKK